MSYEKQLWVLAGGNGAGKTTFYNTVLKQHGIRLLNADLIAKEIDPENPEAVSYDAATFAERLRHDLLRQGHSFCFETVFSHEAKIDFVAHAKALGYEVILVYIHLHRSELNEARVRQRVSEGGHNVPSDKIHSRIPRTVKNIAQALLFADEARLLDNSSADRPFKQVAIVEKGALTETVDPLPQWVKEILKYITH
jgi:predicted ABC-type ATPase